MLRVHLLVLLFAPMTEFEPETCGFEGRCAAQLSLIGNAALLLGAWNASAGTCKDCCVQRLHDLWFRLLEHLGQVWHGGFE